MTDWFYDHCDVRPLILLMSGAKNQDHLLYCSTRDLFKHIHKTLNQLKFSIQLAPDKGQWNSGPVELGLFVRT